MKPARPVLLVLGLAACASHATTAGPGSIKGYGVDPVPGDSQAAMLSTCARPELPSAAADRGTSLDAECDQLRRTLHNQPGNAVVPGATP